MCECGWARVPVGRIPGGRRLSAGSSRIMGIGAVSCVFFFTEALLATSEFRRESVIFESENIVRCRYGNSYVEE